MFNTSNVACIFVPGKPARAELDHLWLKMTIARVSRTITTRARGSRIAVGGRRGYTIYSAEHLS
jgi:hypothetical protein